MTANPWPMEDEASGVCKRVESAECFWRLGIVPFEAGGIARKSGPGNTRTTPRISACPTVPSERCKLDTRQASSR